MNPRPIVSLRRVAEHIGVSVSTVSLALRDSPKISAARREEIKRVAKKMGYRIDNRVKGLMSHLRRPRAQRAKSRIAVLVPELKRKDLANFPRVPAMLRGIHDMATTTGFEVEEVFLSERQQSNDQIRQELLDQKIKGLIVAPFASGVSKLDFDFSGFCAAAIGYSVIDPLLHRACPDYLKMMEEMLTMCVESGRTRVGLVMIKHGGIGFKLFTSSYLYFQSHLEKSARIPMLAPRVSPSATKARVDPERLRRWLERHQPDVVIGAPQVMTAIKNLGYVIPRDIGFASLDTEESPAGTAGANHSYDLVGQEAFKLMLTSLNLNLTGVPEHPRVVLVDSHLDPGKTLTARRQRKSSVA
ncbi:MAG: LacI family DNA-binding transcriptional regulator [Synoicihabitans sp.]